MIDRAALRRAACAGLALAALAACGNSSHAASTSTTLVQTEDTTPATEPEITVPPVAKLPDPCKLVTQADAETAIGHKLAPGKSAGPDPSAPTSCTYTGDPTGPLAQVEVYVGDGAKKYLDIDKQLSHTFTPVKDLGDEATEETSGLFFRKGTTWVAIRFTSLDAPETLRPGLEALGRKAEAAWPT